jgi:bifunctional DNA-binding transcriptional regulator/antitoxin component of YhaV-PrlF toxin-antitoxin module
MRRRTVMSSRGQVVIPMEFRRHLQWDAGTDLIVEWSGRSRRIVLSAVTAPVVLVEMPPAGILRDAYPVSTTYVEQLRTEANRDPLS